MSAPSSFAARRLQPGLPTRDAPGVEFALQRLRRNGNPPVEFTVHRIGDADGSRFEVFAERTRRPRVQLTLTDRADSEVVLSSEDRPAHYPWRDARQENVPLVGHRRHHDRDLPRPAHRLRQSGPAPGLSTGRPCLRGRPPEPHDWRSTAAPWPRLPDRHGRFQLFLTSDGYDGAYAVAVTAIATHADGPDRDVWQLAVQRCRPARRLRERLPPLPEQLPASAPGSTAHPPAGHSPARGAPSTPQFSTSIDAKFATIVLRDVARREPRAAAELRQIQRELQGMPRTRLT